MTVPVDAPDEFIRMAARMWRNGTDTKAIARRCKLAECDVWNRLDEIKIIAKRIPLGGLDMNVLGVGVETATVAPSRGVDRNCILCDQGIPIRVSFGGRQCHATDRGLVICRAARSPTGPG